MSDELSEQVGRLVDKAKGDGVRHVLGLDTMQGDKATTVATAEQIIALVRADERKRIREQLLGDRAVDKAAWLLRFDDDGLRDSSHLEIISSRAKAKSLLDYVLSA